MPGLEQIAKNDPGPNGRSVEVDSHVLIDLPWYSNVSYKGVSHLCEFHIISEYYIPRLLGDIGNQHHHRY